MSTRRRLPSTRSSGRSDSTRTSCATSPSAWTSTRKAPPRCCANPTAIVIVTIAAAVSATATATGTAIAASAARVIATVTAVTGAPRARRRATTARRPRSNRHGPYTDADPPAVLPPPQDLPVLGRQRAEDRLQGREAVAALRVRARQDRAEPHHRGLGQEAARARASDQARALPRPVDLRDQIDSGRTMVDREDQGFCRPPSA